MLRRLLLLSLCTGLLSGIAAADRIVAGSDLLQPALSRAIGDGVLPGIALRLEGSRSGLDDLRAGRADLAVVAFAPDEILPEAEFRLVPIGYQVAVFVVTETNPVQRLSFSQLGGIFGEKEPTNHRQWGSLGAKGHWELKSISINLVEEPGSLAVDLFKSTVLHSPTLKRTIQLHADLDETVRMARVDDTCIVLLPRPLSDSQGLHVLPVARTDDDVAFGPTPENVCTGDYPLRLPFYVAYKRGSGPALKPSLVALLGDQVAAALAQDGFMPAPANVRNEAVTLLDER